MCDQMKMVAHCEIASKDSHTSVRLQHNASQAGIHSSVHSTQTDTHLTGMLLG